MTKLMQQAHLFGKNVDCWIILDLRELFPRWCWDIKDSLAVWLFYVCKINTSRTPIENGISFLIMT